MSEEEIAIQKRIIAKDTALKRVVREFITFKRQLSAKESDFDQVMRFN
jgi:hypothetical protein